jgi:hypothetical protein
MNELGDPSRNKHILECIGARFAPIRRRGRWVKPGRVPQPLVVEKTRRKLLKRKTLLVFQFGKEMPYFRQVTDWRKWETLWVIVGSKCIVPVRGTARGLHLKHLTKGQ